MSAAPQADAGASVGLLFATLKELDNYLACVNDMAATSSELQQLRARVEWSTGSTKALDPEAMDKLLSLIAVYHSIWAKMSACPLASIALAPVRVLDGEGKK